MDGTTMFFGLLFGSTGFGYFIYGRKQSHVIAKYSGLALMVYPYFITNTVMLVVVGIILMLVPKFIKV